MTEQKGGGDALEIIASLSRWRVDAALPFWTDAGPDRVHGGFVEELDFSGRDAARPLKRTRVACRQIYVFSHALMLGWTQGAPLIAHGADYLTTKARLAEGGYAKLLTRAGEVSDPTLDLYDNAFALFAFAWAFRATNDAAYRDLVAETHDAIVRRLSHPSGRGFQDAVPKPALRRQNPHMHLLEAEIAAFQATGDARHAAAAHELLGLFCNFFFDKETETLTEYFAEDLRPAPTEQGRVVEPGHHFEWAWILAAATALPGATQDFAAFSERLAACAERLGVDRASGAVVNAVRNDGAPLDRGSRSWPNTERLKAAVALFEQRRVDPRPSITTTGRLLLDRYLRPQPGFPIPPGAWIDSFDEMGRPNAKAVPASIFYHFFLAIAELERISEALKETT